MDHFLEFLTWVLTTPKAAWIGLFLGGVGASAIMVFLPNLSNRTPVCGALLAGGFVAGLLYALIFDAVELRDEINSGHGKD
jgi:hypothetical protein